jgi:hypothetical protein
MKLTNPEKLILTMLSEIHEKLGIQDGVNTKLLTRAISSNNTWALSWEMPGIVGDTREPAPPEVKEVLDILGMWSFMEEAYEKFDATEKATVKADADPFGNHVRFAGFDGNNETELLSIAEFLIEDMGRFSRFKGRDLNSHSPSIDSYGRMLAIFERIRPTLIGHGLSAEQVVEILSAKRR